MSILSNNDIESELSYAYLHAIAAAAGASCSASGRHEDNRGIDAKITAVVDVPAALYSEVTLNIQLKATTKPAVYANSKYSYWLAGVDRYDQLRADTCLVPRVLVVLFLPPAQNDWLEHTIDKLLLRKCAYWVSLRGAGACTNKSGETVYLPDTQHFSPDALRSLLEKCAVPDFPMYTP